MTSEIFNAIALTFGHAQKAMIAAKDIRFPRHCVVQVNCPRYNGPGIVVLQDGCPADHLAVRIQSQNVWFYMAQSCEPITDRRLWPSWVKKELRKWARIRKRNEREIAASEAKLREKTIQP